MSLRSARIVIETVREGFQGEVRKLSEGEYKLPGRLLLARGRLLISMIGGNLKGLLPPGSALSMPPVLDGIDCAIQIRGANRCERKSFQCSAGPFRISLAAMRAS